MNAQTKLGMMMVAVFLGTVGSVMAEELPKNAAEAVEVSALIKCHEGKFDAMNAVSQLTAEISGEAPAVYGWSGIGAYPEINHPVEGHLVKVTAPFSVSEPAFITVGEVVYACVTVQKK